MSDFKAVQGKKIDQAKKEANELNKKGAELDKQAATIEGLLNEVKLREGADQQQIEALKREYNQEFNSTYESQVEKPLEDVEKESKENQEEISQERKVNETAKEKIRTMQSTSEVGKAAAGKAEGVVAKSIEDYNNMEKIINNDIAKQKSVRNETKSRLKSRFK